MDKYLTRPRNPRASPKQNSSDTTIQDCDNHENYDSQKDIQCSVGKDIRSFFAKPTIAKYDAENESLKTERTSASDVKQLFKKSEEIDLDRIKEKNDKKRQFPESSDEEEAGKSILKIKINWSKRQKLHPEVKIVERSPPSSLAKGHDDASEASEAGVGTTPSDESEVLGESDPANREVSTSNKPTEVNKVHSRSKRTEVDKNDEELQTGTTVEVVNNSLRRSLRRCSIPVRLGSMLENEVKSPRGKKESQLKTAKKGLKVSNRQHYVDDNDDVIIVDVVNNGKATELAPMFRKQPKMSSEEMARRKDFLMSGVPEEIRRQQVALQNQASSASQYAPFPRFNHVTQTSVDDDENESTNSQNPLPYVNVDRKIETPASFFPKNLFDHLRSESEAEKPRLRENLVSASFTFDRSSDVLEQLLLEIKTSDLDFPVKSTYQMLTTKQKFGTTLSKNPIEVLVSDDDDDNDDDEEDDKEEQVEDDRSANEERNLLWTEKYAPARASEIIGNKDECKKVYDWLLDLKAKYSHSSDDKGSDSMDDFWTPGAMNDGGSNHSTFSSNALVVQGPHGIGKTALVYAVARELGFKVFEVNPSSAREGKQVWSQLQEATQSHQLHTSRCHGSTNEEASIGGRKEEMMKAKTEEKPKSKSPRGKVIPSLFGSKVHLKTSNIAKKKQKIIMETAKKNKAPLKKNKFGRKNNQKKGLKSGYSTAAKTSLILFDEADVVFESDRGFWSAVQKFVKNTKRPIVLTVSDENFIQKFGMDIEVVSLKRPSNTLVTSYLRTIALAEGLRLNGSDVEALVESFNCDIRRCILQFQMMFSNKVPKHLSSLRPICYSKSSLEHRLDGLKDWQRNAESESNAVNNCSAFPVELRTSKATKKSRKMNRVESEDDLEQQHVEAKEDDSKVSEGEKKDEFVIVDCEVPVFRIPRVFCERSDVGPARTTKPPFYQNFLTTSLQNHENTSFSSDLLRKHSDGRVLPSGSCNENVRSLELLSVMFDQASWNEVTFRNRLERSTSEATYDLQFRKMSNPLPGESDHFGFDEEREARLSFCRSEEEIRNSIFDLTSRKFSDRILKNGNNLEQSLAKQDGDLLECQRRLTGVFKGRQSLVSDLRKSSVKNRARTNLIPEILPMLIKMSEAENQRKVNKSRRRFLHYLSYVYPNIHPDRFNLRM